MAGKCDPRKILAMQEAVKKDLISWENPLSLYYDLDRFVATMKNVKDVFPSHWIHAMAVKASPVLSLMKIGFENGLTFESASIGEFSQSIKAVESGGEEAKKNLVFDSPIKTRNELIKGLQTGCYLNIDNFQEFERVVELYPIHSNNSKIGIRINPQVGVGSNPAYSTAGSGSKFGISIGEHKEKILDSYLNYKFLNGIHCHVGSQGCSLELIGQGLRKITDLVLEINKKCNKKKITWIDIGGVGFFDNMYHFKDKFFPDSVSNSNSIKNLGLAVNFLNEDESSDTVPSFEEYRDHLKKVVPELFSGEFTVITEFGRRFFSKSGFIASKVEYTKVAGDHKIAMVHGGADLFVRTVYQPEKWPLRITVLDKNGNLKEDNICKQDIAGPCCFAGDIIAHERELPLIEQGDFILAHDTGGYYYSSYSYYNSRQAPPIFGYKNENFEFLELKKGQSVEQTLSFFE